MRIGVSDNAPWTTTDGRPSGIEVDLAKSFAKHLDARIQWMVDSEGDLMEFLERGECDLVIGGLKSSNPWSSRVSFSHPYMERNGQKHVMAVRNGENAWLLELERFLSRQEFSKANTHESQPGV